MSFSQLAWLDLQAAGGAVLRKYQRLMREADGAQHGSPAELAKRRFEMAWQNDPVGTKLQAEDESVPHAIEETG